MRNLFQETTDICNQLSRYGDCVYNADLADVLWVITDINDDLCHGRDPSLIRDRASEAIVLLQKLIK